MAKTFDVIVVGVGTMGAATCWHLSRQGYRVLGIDRYSVPHGLGAHHGHSRMIRLSYFEHPDYVPLLKRSYSLWNELEHEANRKILIPTGGLYLGPDDGGIVPGCLRASKEHGLPYELLDQASLSSRYPQFRLEDGYIGFYESASGGLLVEPAMRAHMDLIRRQGGQINGDEAVLDWHASGDSVSVRTSKSEYSAARLVIAGGAWSGDLLKGLGVNLRVTRQTMFWLSPSEREPFDPERLPAWFVETRDGRGIYGFPRLPGRSGVKVAEHFPGPEVTPDSVDRECKEADWTELRPKVNRFFPGLIGEMSSMETCLYTNSPDGHFILDRHPNESAVCFGAGFSGHGFKFAPVIGEALAQLAIDGESSLPIDFLGVDRFR
jgi:sarcosine oxidase